MNFTEIGQAIREACQTPTEVLAIRETLLRAISVTRNPGAMKQILEGFGPTNPMP